MPLGDTGVYFSRKTNEYGEVLAAPTIETTILSYTPSSTLDVIQAVCWGDYDGEFLLKVDNEVRGGGRTSAADRTLMLDYSSAPISVPKWSTFTVTVTHYAIGGQRFKANFLGGLV